MASVSPTTLRKKFYRIAKFSEFEEFVANEQPDVFRPSTNQIQAIKGFLASQQCGSILVETHYTDRTFLDEYQEFYSRSFKPYSHHCTRLHFFSLETTKLKEALKEIHHKLVVAAEIKDEYFDHCKKFSDTCYLGFMVVKPLPATRIGRTVLRHPNHDNSNPLIKFPCTKTYSAHVLGLELSVCGLPFQQQDGGMSACASTATWASLSNFSEFEDLQTPSPAQITKAASAQGSSFGRSIPQENGLSVGQMCSAVEAAGLSPYMVRCEHVGVDRKKALLYTTIKSGFSPILIIEKDNENEKHAISVGGMVLDPKDAPPSRSLDHTRIREVSSRLTAIYCNDDRIAPYHLGQIDEDGALIIRGPEEVEQWNIESILIPLHSKIRLGIEGLYENAVLILDDVFGKFLRKRWRRKPTVSMETWITPAKLYRRHVLFGLRRLNPRAAHRLDQGLSFPRYLAIVRFTDKALGTIDLLVDVTNTSRHFNVILVLGREVTADGIALTREVASQVKSPFLIDALAH